MKIISGLVLLLAINLTFGGFLFSGINYAEASSHEVILGATAGDVPADVYFIDPRTGLEIEYLGDASVSGVEVSISAIDVRSDGLIFAGANRALGGPLVELSLVPGGFEVAPVPGFASNACNGMSFAPDGTLYCFNKGGFRALPTNGLFAIDIDAQTKTGTPENPGTSGNGLVVSADGTIYHAGDDGLNILNPISGGISSTQPWQFPPEIDSRFCKANAMDFSSDGILYASMDCRDNILVTIDFTTNSTVAQVTLIGQTINYLDAIAFVSGPGIPDLPQLGSIHGMKWNDANTNGILDGTEQGVPDVEICLYLNEGEGEFPQEVTFDDTFGIQIAEANIGPIGGFEEIACVFTDDNGQYWFENLLPGFYIVEEFLVDQIQVFPNRDYVDEFGECPFFYESSCLDLLDFFHPDDGNPSIPHFIEVASGERVENVNFGNIPAGFLHGMKWDDANENGIHDAGEVGVSGIEVLLFKLTPPDTQGEFVSSTFTMIDDPNTPENEDGLYWFTVEPGTYRIVEVSPLGSSQTFPTSSAPHYAVVTSGEVVSGLDFGNTAALPGSIHGIKFSDANRNGIHDAGESGVPNVTFCLSSGICTQTNIDGEFWFETLSPGEYVVSETVPSNSVNTTPIILSVIVTTGEETLISFGNTAPLPPPTEVTVSPLNTWGSGGLPSVYWQNNITISKDTGPTGFDHCGTDSPVSVTLQLDFTQTATVELVPMDLVGPGDIYSTTLAPFFPLHGLLNLTFLVECPLGPEIQQGGSIYIDPSGQITDICTDLPIEGAQVTLYKQYPPTGEFFIAEETDYIEDTGSVQTTGADGRYAWNTVAGNYKVSASALGFITQESPIVPIPPPVLDLDVALEREGGCTTDPVTNDHYLSYKAKQPKGTDKFEKFTVTLDDQFESASYTVDKPDRLFNPVQKTHDGVVTDIADEISHYVGYKIKIQKGDDKFEKVSNILVQNQFGDIIVDVKKAKLLLVPSAKDHFTEPNPLDPVTVDHYKCYDAKETKHTPKFEKLVVSLYDPNFEIAQDFEVKKPKMLCIPVQKTHDGTTTEITNEENNLMCYDTKKLKGDNKFEKINVFTNNQFGPEELKVEKQEELCVPSKILE